MAILRKTEVNFSRSYITTSVSNTPHYDTKINLLGKPFNLRCGYSTRNNLRWITITDLNNNPILNQTFLKVGKVCELNALSEEYDLSYSVTLKPKSKTKEFSKDYDYLKWSEDFDLYFFGRTQEIQEIMEVNLRKIYVGN
jgi:hypothetical protein